MNLPSVVAAARATAFRDDASGERAHLQVVLRVPVRVVDYDGVGGREVDAESARARTQEEDEAVGVGFTEPVDRLLTQVTTDTAVYTLVEVPETQTQN